jgi:hypothetical protein
VKDSLVRRSGGLIEAEVDGELIGLEIEQGVCYGFNGTATRIWAMIEEPKRISDIRDALLTEFEVDPETCERELRAVLADLEADGLVVLEAVSD